MLAGWAVTKNPLTLGPAVMDDTPCRHFFREPSGPLQRQYEALRAVFLDGLSQKEAAGRFGYSYDPFRQLVHQFRHRCAAGAPPPLFPSPRPGRRPPRPPPPPARPEPPAIADARTVSLAPGRRLRTRLAGALLFLPLLARLRLDHLAERAGYPGSAMIPSPAALLSLLALKLLDKERRRHVNDFNFDEALGLFAGLNVLPHTSFPTHSSF